MNYFVPPQGVHQVPNIQGVPGLVQVGQMGQMHQMIQPGQMQLAHGGLGPQVVAAAAASHPPLHMVPQHLQPHIQPGLISAAPRVVPVQQAQLQQLIAVSQYQQAQYQQAIRQQSLQRAITSVTTTRPTVLTPKTPPLSSILKPDSVDAEVQTPECDASPEADSSTKARIITPMLMCCSNIVSSEYRQLQCRILTWVEQNERQALEVTRVKADISPNSSSSMPATTASVIILDDRNLQFNVCGKVVKSCIIPEKEDSQLDEQKVREYLDLLADNYSFCHGLSDLDLQSIGPLAVVKCDNLVQRQVPVSGAFAIKCTRWCKIPEDNEGNVRCDECKHAFEILSTKDKSVQLCVAPGKRPAPLCHDDLPTQPCAKRPRLLEVNTAKLQLDVICEQMVEFQSSDKDEATIKKFLEELGSDLQQIRSLYQEVKVDEVKEEESKKMPDDEESEKKMEEESKNDIEADLISVKSPNAESEDIDEEALLNGTEDCTNGEENHVIEANLVVTKTISEESEGKQPQQELNEENVSIVNGDGESTQ